MKSTIILFALIGGAHSAWLRWSVNREPVWTPQETGRATQVDAVGWSPVPTPAPGVVTGEVVLDLFKRQTTSNNWTNSETCGWFSGVSSSAVMCGNDFTCATNSDHIVACASGTVSQFFSACLDYSAFQDGKCNGVDSATGCW
ncbi:hypothetical protein F5Y15DRAFT_404405 [Xylariaceae sp. FL0016]|nr:hypothetical protein F5Y15DRAFT_404405 [Xylariaceae sp. FL0016]